MQSKAKTVAEYLKSLPADRRATIEAIRAVFLKHLDKGFEEGMQYGAIGYYVPHRFYPNGYHCDPKQPLPWAGLGSQKNYVSMGFMSLYLDPAENARFVSDWKKAGKKLDMGKACIRIKKLEDVPLDVVAGVVKSTSAARYIAAYEGVLLPKNKAAAKRGAAKKGAAAKSKSAAKPKSAAKASGAARKKSSTKK